MHRLLLGLIVCVCVAPALRAQAPTPPTPAPAPIYDATFIIENAAEYVGTTTFSVGDKGDVSGALTIVAPLEGTGTISGPVKDGTWTARIEFTLTTQACRGVVTGSATIPADGKVISGSGTVLSSCAPDPQSATFRFTRK